jgi:hypothetical protein
MVVGNTNVTVEYLKVIVLSFLLFYRFLACRNHKLNPH